MLRRLHPEQPDGFAFTPDNQKWAEAQITKYPSGRQASAIIPLLWRAQEQEGWLSRVAIEHVCDMLDMAHIRGLEVATFYFMFQLQPIGSVANIQICGTTSCMICGAEDLVAVCKEKIAPKPHQLSADGKFTWEEVECLGACANAPMAQIGKDYYEDLTTARFAEIVDELADGKVPTPGPQNGRYASEPVTGLTSLSGYEETGHTKMNASVQLASDIGDTIKRIDGTEVPLLAPWQGKSAGKSSGAKAKTPKRADEQTAPKKAKPAAKAEEPPKKAAKPAVTSSAKAEEPSAEELASKKPAALDAPKGGKADDLKKIKGIGQGLEKSLNENGIFHYDQIAKWTADEVLWADYGLARFKGRATRDTWVEQAKLLAAGEETEFSKRAKY
ncbi:NADH-ubiquinone oxidoreductase chain E [Candidatus Rhodobacter oscarellae]|uniref:NADH-ubiquinone oxidoreductase chain E n=1 Tax=Candidatus Rhodobacter oscarellae TaxID=1675527 RepID=A0A0J9E7V3_9RHOB|nr:NADH-quinone oxidoreductase subunit E [Candidatus Rhodobacter lobularis]KMW57844.1 NADH-ubiquinone oxidoreductase chain E [Candidatus Rhodobacter lobularis]